jgi:hypothetical protein
MHICLFVETPQTLRQFGTSAAEVRAIVHHVAQTAGVRDAVIACYFPDKKGWGGKMLGGTYTPETFTAASDAWAFVARWRPPADLPATFRLVRLWVGTDLTYPYDSDEAYGWRWRFRRVQDHLALLTAHEGYHLVRRQPDPDPVTEEHRISYQAILLVQSLGYGVQAVVPEDAVPCP